MLIRPRRVMYDAALPEFSTCLKTTVPAKSVWLGLEHAPYVV